MAKIKEKRKAKIINELETVELSLAKYPKTGMKFVLFRDDLSEEDLTLAAKNLSPEALDTCDDAKIGGALNREILEEDDGLKNVDKLKLKKVELEKIEDPKGFLSSVASAILKVLGPSEKEEIKRETETERETERETETKKEKETIKQEEQQMKSEGEPDMTEAERLAKEKADAEQATAAAAAATAADQVRITQEKLTAAEKENNETKEALKVEREARVKQDARLVDLERKEIRREIETGSEKKYPNIPMKKEKLVDLILWARETSPDHAKEIEDVLERSSKMIEVSVLTELGTTGTEEERLIEQESASPARRFEREIRELQKSDPKMSRGAAVKYIAQSEPKLYSSYVQEQRKRSGSVETSD